MKILARLVFLFIVWSFLLQCGGPKQLSPDEYEQLSPQDRIIYLNRQIEKNPNDLQLKKMLYQEYKTIKMYDQAQRVMEEILQIDPNQTDIQFELGEIAYQRGNLKAAYQAFIAVLQSPNGEIYKSKISNYITGPYLIQQITSDPADEAFPSFSPDGRQILFQKFINGNWDIVTMDLETGAQKVLVSTPADEELPVYSPDGKLIVYTSNAEDHRPIDNRFKVREIFEMKLEDQYIFNLSHSVADDWLPRFNHAGNQIIFVSERSDLRRVNYTEKRSDLFIMETDGDFQRPLTHNDANEGGACFSADDQKIFFHADRNGTFDIFMMDRDGKNVMTIIGDKGGDDVNPCASPDSVHLTFFSDRDNNFEIYLSKIDGTEQQRLTFHPAEDVNPVFSPDGKVIAFHSNRNGNFDIYFINLEVPTTALTTNELISRLNELVKQ